MHPVLYRIKQHPASYVQATSSVALFCLRHGLHAANHLKYVITSVVPTFEDTLRHSMQFVGRFLLIIDGSPLKYSDSNDQMARLPSSISIRGFCMPEVSNNFRTKEKGKIVEAGEK